MANTAQQVNFSDVLSSLVSQYGVTKGPGASNNQMNIQDVMAIYNNLASQYAANSFDLGMAMNLYNQANNRIERQTAETRARQDKQDAKAKFDTENNKNQALQILGAILSMAPGGKGGSGTNRFVESTNALLFNDIAGRYLSSGSAKPNDPYLASVAEMLGFDAGTTSVEPISGMSDYTRYISNTLDGMMSTPSLGTYQDVRSNSLPIHSSPVIPIYNKDGELVGLDNAGSNYRSW